MKKSFKLKEMMFVTFCLHYTLSPVATQTRAFDRKGENNSSSHITGIPWCFLYLGRSFDMPHHTWSISCACYTIGTVFNHYDMNVLCHAKPAERFTPRPGIWYQYSTTMQKCIKHAQGELITNPSSRHWFSIR